MYGVCFGHQHLARTFGGWVEQSPAGWALGTVGVTLTEEGRRDSLSADFPDTFPVQQSHGEVVAELPPGVRALAHNPQTAYQAFALGDAVWGTQFHLEFTPEAVHALIGLLAEGFRTTPSRHGRPRSSRSKTGSAKMSRLHP